MPAAAAPVFSYLALVAENSFTYAYGTSVQAIARLRLPFPHWHLPRPAEYPPAMFFSMQRDDRQRELILRNQEIIQNEKHAPAEIIKVCARGAEGCGVQGRAGWKGPNCARQEWPIALGKGLEWPQSSRPQVRDPGGEHRACHVPAGLPPQGVPDLLLRPRPMVH